MSKGKYLMGNGWLILIPKTQAKMVGQRCQFLKERSPKKMKKNKHLPLVLTSIKKCCCSFRGCPNSHPHPPYNCFHLLGRTFP